MRNMIRSFLILLIIPLGVKAGGYQVNLVGIRYIGMGHIGTALSRDAGTIFYNPGNLSFLKDKCSITGGVSAVWAYTAFRKSGSDYTAETTSPVSPPFSLFGSYKINDKIAVGLGVYTPFGSTVKWEENWAGKYLVKDISLRTICIQPSASYAITEKISIGAGLVIANGKVELNKAVPLNSAEMESGNAKLEGSTTNVGFNAGIGFKATEELSLGFSYRSRINMNVEGGDATFTVPSSVESNFPNTTFDATLPLPANWNLGAAYQFTDKLMVGLDVNYVQWSAYDSLIFDFKDNTSSLTDSRSPKEYKNTFIFRVGGEYKASDKLTARLGGYYDNSPVDKDRMSPETPDANRMGLSAGLSYSPVEKLSIDASFLFVNEFKRTASYEPENFGGVYKSLAYIPGIGLSYNF